MKILNWKLKIIIAALLLGSAIFYILNNQSEDIINSPKSPNLIEQNLDPEDENFSVLSTKLDKDKNTYQLSFELQNTSDQEKTFHLIPVSQTDQAQFQNIKEDSLQGGTATWDYEAGWDFDQEKHKQELIPELAQAYDDIDTGGYTGKPIKLTLSPQTTLIAQAQWGLSPDRVAAEGSFTRPKPIYFLVHGSAGGAKDVLDILNLYSPPRAGDDR
jgi:hypothetical protein